MPNRDANMRANKQTLVAEFDITDLYMQECSNTIRIYNNEFTSG